MYKTRVKVFLGIIAAVLVLLGLRIGDLQIHRGEEYRDEFERSLRQTQYLPAARGQITDRAGKILAVDLPCKDFCLDYRFLTRDPQWVARQVRQIQRASGLSRMEANDAFLAREAYAWRLADQLAQGAGTDLSATVGRITASVRRIREGVRRRSGSDQVSVTEEVEAHPVVLALSEEEAVRVEADLLGGRTVGASLRPGRKRYYPYADLACHVVGLTGAVTEDDLERLNVFPADSDRLAMKRQGYEPDDFIGNGGVEKMCEASLRGRRGYRVLDTGERVPQEIAGEPAEGGGDVHLTLDATLQDAVAKRLRETGHNGAAVVLSVAHGEVLAMASVPTYDLNRYREDVARLNDDEFDFPLLNRAAGVQYPPGSSIKPVVALAALAVGRITPATIFECAGSLNPSRPFEFECTGHHGEVDLHRAIMKSCNVYFYHVGERLGLPAAGEWFRQFGIHEKPGVGLPEEKAGNVVGAAWIDDPRNRKYLLNESRQEGIGQGMLLVTPVHMANAMATIARDGRWRPPMLVLEAQRDRAGRDLPAAPGSLSLVREAMRNVVGTPGGTGYNAFHAAGVESLGVEVCGKSGTAQFHEQRLQHDHGERGKAGEVVREGKMVWFVGFAPAARPKVAFAVLVEYVVEGTGGSVAAPVARDILRFCKDLGYLSD